MKKIIFIFFILILLSACTLNQDVPSVEINNKVFKVEVAQTSQQHYQGLSGRESLAEDAGMLFVFDDYRVRNFVMRKMNFPLAMVWIKDEQVVGCSENVPIFDEQGEFSVRSSSQEINYVLEINAGMCDKYQIQSGDEVDIKL